MKREAARQLEAFDLVTVPGEPPLMVLEVWDDPAEAVTWISCWRRGYGVYVLAHSAAAGPAPIPDASSSGEPSPSRDAPEA